MKVSAIQCNDCRDIVYSRARHDFRWCTCKNCAIDGGLDYLRVIGDGYKMKTLVIESTKEELYNDWNNSKDLFGLVSNTDQLNEVEEKRMKPEIEDTDIIIRRVSNGWIVFTGSEYEADHFIVTVHEEGETAWGEHEALIGLFREHFDAFTQSKKHGGIKLEVREGGYAFEEDEEDERGFMDAALDDVLEEKDEG